MSHALLPPEIWVNIIQYATYTSNTPLQTLLNIALLSRRFHHIVFCPENDSAVWRTTAIRFGLPPSTRLEDALYGGNASLNKRTWQQMSILLKAWQTPFPSGKLNIPNAAKALRYLPPRDIKEDPFGKRTLELYCVGEGDRHSTNFQAKRPLQEDEGCAIIQANNLRHVRHSAVAAVVDPLLDKIIQVAGRIVPSNTSKVLYPLTAGYIVTDSRGTYTVRKVDGSTAKLGKSWSLGSQKPERFVGRGDVLVALVHDNSLGDPLPQNATQIVCLKSTTTGTIKLWEMETTLAWPNDEPYYSFANLKGFHVTSQHVVFLVTRHPNASQHKLTGTYFYVHDLETGQLAQPIKFRNKEIEKAIAQTSSSEETEDGLPSRPAFTTAFSHDFLVTDTIAISGGLGGGLFVWSLSNHDTNPIYCIPVPSNPGTTFLRPYTSITMSACGRYVGAATSDRLYIFDMISKKLSAIYDNGRKISQQNTYVKNPQDGFQAGLWVLYNDWISNGRNSPKLSTSKQCFWERRSEGVAYLTNVADNFVLPGHFESLMEILQAPSRIQTILGFSDDVWRWLLLGGMGILICLVWTCLGMGRNILAPYLGRLLETFFRVSDK